MLLASEFASFVQLDNSAGLSQAGQGGSAPGTASVGDTASGHTPADAQAGAAPPSAQPNAAASGPADVDADSIKQLQQITGQGTDACQAALAAAGGNVELAAGSLMGW